ncbi:MAG: hypothetical protein M1832_003518 [Thelocarpon impressellum]|nr:MAG: hypothetical protein M1832_003518 [Thelocarpon impressellum]
MSTSAATPPLGSGHLSLSSTPTTSQRPSLDSPSLSATPSPSRLPPTPGSSAGPPRPRNRAALRDYYNLRAQAGESTAEGSADGGGDEVEASELDRPGFDAEGYVRTLLEREGLEGVLRVEGRLVNEIRALDGERKALVYDNYSKLISATDTIRNMRTNMDPLAPTTSTLAPAISHIAESAASLASPPPRSPHPRTAPARPRQERDTARWVVDAPARLRRMAREGRVEEARREWGVVLGLLERWGSQEGGVEGVERVREEGERVLREAGGVVV